MHHAASQNTNKRRRADAEQPDAASQHGQGLDQLAAAAAAAAAAPQEPPLRRRRFEESNANEAPHTIPLTSSSSEDSTSSSGEDTEDDESKKAKLVLDPALGVELSATTAEWDALLDERQEMDSNDDTSDWLDRVFVVSRRYRAVTDRVNAARIV
ncbi:MAG: hypothetical protein SGARI_006724 [Bacillariaceae sp.]